MIKPSNNLAIWCVVKFLDYPYRSNTQIPQVRGVAGTYEDQANAIEKRTKEKLNPFLLSLGKDRKLIECKESEYVHKNINYGDNAVCKFSSGYSAGAR